MKKLNLKQVLLSLFLFLFFSITHAADDQQEARAIQQEKEDYQRFLSFLKKCKEPDLRSLKPGVEVYRFIYIPTLDRKFLILTLKIVGERPVILVHRLSAKMQTELTGMIEIDAVSFKAFRQKLSQNNIQNPLEGLSASQKQLIQPLDGASWHLETLRDGQYTYSITYSPITMGYASKEQLQNFKKEYGFAIPSVRNYVRVCLSLLDYAGLPLDATNFAPVPMEPYVPKNIDLAPKGGCN